MLKPKLDNSVPPMRGGHKPELVPVQKENIIPEKIPFYKDPVKIMAFGAILMTTGGIMTVIPGLLYLGQGIVALGGIITGGAFWRKKKNGNTNIDKRSRLIEAILNLLQAIWEYISDRKSKMFKTK